MRMHLGHAVTMHTCSPFTVKLASSLSGRQRFLRVVASVSIIKHLATQQARITNALRSQTRRFQCWLFLWTLCVFVHVSTCRTCWTNKSNPQRLNPTDLQHLKSAVWHICLQTLTWVTLGFKFKFGRHVSSFLIHFKVQAASLWNQLPTHGSGRQTPRLPLTSNLKPFCSVKRTVAVQLASNTMCWTNRSSYVSSHC